VANSLAGIWQEAKRLKLWALCYNSFMHDVIYENVGIEPFDDEDGGRCDVKIFIKPKGKFRNLATLTISVFSLTKTSRLSKYKTKRLSRLNTSPKFLRKPKIL
jgi:hypothetical protein